MKTHVTRSVRPNPAISAGALSRLVWAVAALVVLWAAIYWGLS